ncbi:MAG: hypothetical protein JSS79_15530 [Bacteroidetes bacterium]|nr:hypothetical protein [Bacteroidota bacterium]
MLIFLLQAILSFSQLKPASNKAFFNYPSKVGLVLEVGPIEYMKESDIPVNYFSSIRIKKKKQESKYDEALKTIEPAVDPTDAIRRLYQDLYEARKKTIVLIKEPIDSGLAKFRNYGQHEKTYFARDLRPLKDKLQVHHLLMVSVDYGLITGGPLGIEFNKKCFVLINSVLVDLRDNSIVFRTKSDDVELVYEWNTPPEYGQLRRAVERATFLAIREEQRKYEW